MAEYNNGCLGCIDFDSYSQFCDYLGRNGHVRPCRADAAGCALYSGKPRPGGTEASRRTWDAKAARRLLARGKTAAETAVKVGASVNSMKVWARRQGLVWKAAERQGSTPIRKESGGVAVGEKTRPWKRAEEYRALYDKGLTDPEAGARMGLSVSTICYYREKMGLEANRYRRVSNELV